MFINSFIGDPFRIRESNTPTWTAAAADPARAAGGPR
jgi:hypothetical protein